MLDDPIKFFSSLTDNLPIRGESCCDILIKEIPAGAGYQILTMEYHQDILFDGEMHINSCSQWIIVLDGYAKIIAGTEKKVYNVSKGSLILIPKDTPHGIEIRAGYKDITFYEGTRY